MKGGKRGEERAGRGGLGQEAGGRPVLAFTSTAAVVVQVKWPWTETRASCVLTFPLSRRACEPHSHHRP